MPEDFVSIKKETSGNDSLCCSNEAYYPYGTQLNFEDDLIEELGAGALAVGDVVEVRGFAVVRSRSEREDEDGSDKNLSIQFTEIKIKREADDKAKQLYGG